MERTEIDEISTAFQEAWTDYFGDEMYYVTFLANETVKDSLYNESKLKKYDQVNKKPFHGTLKESPMTDELKQMGEQINKRFEISFVTKELVDQGILYVNTRDLIEYVDRFGTTHKYRITDEYQKVQFSTDKIFTKLEVIPI